ncbi:TBC1 domain family member 20 [Trichinella papuae]|uniref:TBC1 domain family member 20 n=1 Tax=Trichinella papuae TaxID=268474 RepID=A0A0V1MAJ0_9BILA|nr:TBC1 domain family member 20 [Trichinella papuae]
MNDFMTLSSKEIEKLSIIEKCLNDQDINMLKKLAVSKGGLMLNHCRRKGWLLLTCGVDALDENIASEERAYLQKHEQYNQVYLDAIRTSSRFPSTMQKEQREYYQKVLCRIIVNILIENPSFQYFQGFHDVCLTVLLAISETHALAVCDNLAKTAFRSFLEEPLGNAIEKLELILKIVREIDVEVYEFFETHSSKAEFAVSWILTWYAHVMRDQEQLFRLYDYFLASDEHMPIYVAAAIVLWRRSEILNPQSDYGRVHQKLCTFPKQFPIEAIINDAQDLYESYPPIIFASAVNRILDFTRSASTAYLARTIVCSFNMESFSAVFAVQERHFNYANLYYQTIITSKSEKNSAIMKEKSRVIQTKSNEVNNFAKQKFSASESKFPLKTMPTTETSASLKENR